MSNSTFKYDFNDLKINVSQIKTLLGYNEGEDHEIVTSLIEEILKESESFSNIKAEYRIFNGIRLNNIDKSLDINRIKFKIQKIVFGQIKEADSVAVILCTAGKEVGKCSRKAMQEGDPLKGYIFDIVGSLIVEATADLMQDDLEKYVISSGKKITNRYSPGYCGWYVAEQHKLFRLVPDNFCGITLTDSALMDPVKSISGIIGIGNDVRFNPCTCDLCDQKNCIYRSMCI
jgi:hypothetical protein